MATATSQTRHYWIFSADPHHYHWDTLFVKGKEMWHGAAGKPDAIRALKQVRKGDRVLCYHSAPERSLYSIAEVARDPYPDPHDTKGKNLVADLRAFEKLPRPVTLAEMRGNPAVRKMKLLKNVRVLISSISDAEYQELLRMAGIVATPGVPLPWSGAAEVPIGNPRFRKMTNLWVWCGAPVREEGITPNFCERFVEDF
jgi:predicted RNA-binding protein with PUA-like domain